jgi:formylglycine-generating enzyme required for sulfatase activity
MRRPIILLSFAVRLALAAQPRSDASQSPNQTATQSARIGAVQVNPKAGMKYVWIPSGTFLMGCSPQDSDCNADERPAHRLSISKGFWMGQTPVTVRAYLRCASATGQEMPPSPEFNSDWANEIMPMAVVNWYEALSHCQWAGGRLSTPVYPLWD